MTRHVDLVEDLQMPAREGAASGAGSEWHEIREGKRGDTSTNKLRALKLRGAGMPARGTNSRMQSDVKTC